MGLDVYKYRVLKEGREEKDSSIILYKDETNKSILKLFEKFQKFVVEAEEELVDWKKTFQKRDKDSEEYHWFLIDEKGYHFRNDKTKEVEIFDTNEMVMYKEPVKKLYIKESGYQRKGMVKEFYSEFLSGCWYIVESEKDEDDSIDYISDNETLEKAKTYLEKDITYTLPMASWVLEEDEFIHFSY